MRGAGMETNNIPMNDQRAEAIKVLKTCNGHVAGIIRMIEEGRYCIDIANQLVAVEALVKKANRLILTQHLQHCVVEASQSDEAEEKAAEIVAVINKLLG